MVDLELSFSLIQFYRGCLVSYQVSLVAFAGLMFTIVIEPFVSEKLIQQRDCRRSRFPHIKDYKVFRDLPIDAKSPYGFQLFCLCRLY